MEINDNKSNLYKLKFWKNFINPGNIMLFVLGVESLKWVYLLVFENFRDLDYSSYHDQSKLYLLGQKDYFELRGLNGPCFYPALHMYTYALLVLITNDRANAIPAVICTTIAYLTIWYFAVKIYQAAFGKKSPNVLLIAICCISTRPSILATKYAFWDSFNVMFTYIAIYMFQNNYGYTGWAFISIAMGYKMNVLMYIPGLFYIMSLTKGIWKAFLSLIIMTIMQGVWGIEFLIYNSESYIKRAFHFSRLFHMTTSQIYRWLLWK